MGTKLGLKGSLLVGFFTMCGVFGFLSMTPEVATKEMAKLVIIFSASAGVISFLAVWIGEEAHEAYLIYNAFIDNKPPKE